MLINIRSILCALVVILSVKKCHSAVNKVPELFKWKTISYSDIPDSAYEASNFNQYKPESSIPMSVAHYNRRLFISVPRLRVGVPSTLNYIDLDLESNKFYRGPPLRPYPDFETNELTLKTNPNRISSVWRSRVDACHRLWFVDTGMLEDPKNHTRIQNPSLWIMDLKTDRVIRRAEIVDNLGNYLTSVTVDVTDKNCDDAYAYIPNIRSAALWVYSLRENKFWSFSHNYFSFDPVAGDFNLGGLNFRWGSAIMSLALGATQADGYRTVYFHAMSSFDEFTTSSKVLQNQTLSKKSNSNDFSYLGRRGPNRQCNMHALDLKTGVIVYAEVGLSGIGCWNTNLPFSANNHDLLAQDDDTLFYPADLTIDNDSVIWAISNKIPRFTYSTLDSKDYNFRVFHAPVKEAIAGSRCDLKN